MNNENFLADVLMVDGKVTPGVYQGFLCLISAVFLYSYFFKPDDDLGSLVCGSFASLLLFVSMIFVSRRAVRTGKMPYSGLYVVVFCAVFIIGQILRFVSNSLLASDAFLPWLFGILLVLVSAPFRMLAYGVFPPLIFAIFYPVAYLIFSKRASDNIRD